MESAGERTSWWKSNGDKITYSSNEVFNIAFEILGSEGVTEFSRLFGRGWRGFC
jgi:hypothetical protein